jgi:hypothetical protein
VKCPLCTAEYTLQEALDQVPPMLIVVDPGPFPSAVMSEAAVGAELDACSTGMLPQVEFPDSERDQGLPHFADDDDDDAHLALGEEVPAEDGAMIGGPLRPVADESFDLDERRDGRRRSEAGRSGPRRRGALAELVKVILGAVVGLAIGYYILLLLGRDPMQLRPLFEAYLPQWLVPQ